MNNMGVILFEYLPPIIILLIAGVLSYYTFKLIYSMTEQVKNAKTIRDVVFFIIATLVLSIMLIFMVAILIEAVV